MIHRRMSGYALTVGLIAIVCCCWTTSAPGQTVQTTLMQISTGSTNFGYAGSDTNSCAIDHNNLISFGNYQYVAYYGPDTQSGGNTLDDIYISRRALDSTAWSTPIDTHIAITDIGDDHNVIAMGIDPNGYMHMSWDMHNVTLNYAISTAPVTGSTFNSSLSFNNLTTSAPPSLFTSDPANAGGASRVNEVTYPEFFNVPGTNQLIFSYRNGGAGGGSGNGNQYIDAYTPNASNPALPGTWTNTFMINGEQTSVNAYLNGFVYDSHNNLLTTWTWRATPVWQTNSNIMFAQSPDNGLTWYQQGGATQYPLVADPPAAIIQTGSPSALVGQIIKTLPQNTSFINQTTMAVDDRDRPIVATYWAPGTLGTTNANGTPNLTTNNPNLQYMLVYYDGSNWQTSQVSHRTSDTVFDTTAADVRDLGRPIVLVDQQNRVLVVTRSEDTSQGSFAKSSTPNNNYVIYYNDDLMNGGSHINDADWKHFTLPQPNGSYLNLGSMEPTYDSDRWTNSDVLDLFYQSIGISGQTSSAVSVLEWNEQQYFAGDVNSDGKLNASDVSTLMAALSDVSGFESAHDLTDSQFKFMADVNGDGAVNNADIQALIAKLASDGGGSSLAAVPEPASAVLALIGVVVLGLCASRRYLGPAMTSISALR